MNDPYLNENGVLRNLLNIDNERELDLAEAEISRAAMMLLYEEGFQDFSSEGLKQIHKTLFGDVYEWAGKFRIINLQKREPILVGRSVWYSNCTEIEDDLSKAWNDIYAVKWTSLTREDFADSIARLFPKLWQAHPFREGNTRTIVMMMTFFVENYGYYFDQDLMAKSAGYVRNSFVLASLGEHSEYVHLENILKDAISDTPINMSEVNGNDEEIQKAKYEKYESENYEPGKHEYVDDIKQAEYYDSPLISEVEDGEEETAGSSPGLQF